MKTLSKYFINGLIVTVPIAITLFVVLEIFDAAENILGKHLPVRFPGIGLVAGLALIFIIGWLSSHWMLRRLIEFGERLLDKIPFVKFIYSSVKKVFTAVFESHQLFKQAVLVPFPHPGSKVLGFIVPGITAQLSGQLEGEQVCVFVPMSLNMTSGFNIIVPKKDIILLEISSESALQYILTAGAIMPDGNEVSKT